jgi:Leucine-rich repeat (LRR) protein
VTHSLVKILHLTNAKSLGKEWLVLLWNALLTSTIRHVKSGSFEAQSLSNLTWAYAKVKGIKVDVQLLDDIANRAIPIMDDFAPQWLANVAWGFATLNHKAPSLFDAIADAAQARSIEEFAPQALSNLILAYAKMNHNSPALFDVIAQAAQVRINEFKPQSLSNTAWAFASLNHKATLLFDAVADAAQVQINEFNPQDISTLIGVYAKINHNSPDLFDAIAKAA